MIRRRLAGLAATVLIIGIIAGIPTLLLAIGANPFPHGLPSLADIKSALTTPDDGTLALTVIKIVAEIAWLLLTVSILIEIVAALRRVRMPQFKTPQLPGLRLPQSMARSLVSTAVMLFVATPLGTVAAHAAPVHHTPPPAAATHAAGQHTGSTSMSKADKSPANFRAGAGHAASRTRGSSSGSRQPTVEHTVDPGETLWSIAENHLGDGRRYKEIVDLNKDLLGGKASFLRPGWVLNLPAPAKTPGTPAGTVIVEKGDTLSGIAEQQLGDADRYPEIFQASKSITQPDGGHLTNPNIIDTGWTLKLPATNATTHRNTSRGSEQDTDQSKVSDQSKASEHNNGRDHSGRQSTSSSDHAAGPATTGDKTTGHKSTRDQPKQTAPRTTPATSAPSTSTQASNAPTSAQSASSPATNAPAGAGESVNEDSDWMVRTGYGVGAILAAGVVTLLAVRRRNQQRRRRPGQRLPEPAPQTAHTEQQLRATADSLSVETVDLALRDLARTCGADKTPLPVVRAGRLTNKQFDLYLAEPAQLPTPWTDSSDSTVWTLAVQDTTAIQTAGLTNIPAPYPSLVTIGHDEEDGHVFLDLEHLGSLAIAGAPDQTREVLAALAIELATSTWADDLQVTIVGAFPELEDTLQTGRIRYLPSTGRILEELTDRTEQDRHALRDASTPDLHTARVTGAAPDAWAPEIVLLAGNITDRQRNQLEHLLGELPRVAVATITTGDVKVGDWSLNLTPDHNASEHSAGRDGGFATLDPIGLQLRPQHLPADQYGQLLEMVALTEVDELEPTPEPNPDLAHVETLTRTIAEPAAAAADTSHRSAVTVNPPADLPFTGVLLPDSARQTHQANDATADDDQTTDQAGDPAAVEHQAPAHDQAPAEPDADEPTVDDIAQKPAESASDGRGGPQEDSAEIGNQPTGQDVEEEPETNTSDLTDAAAAEEAPVQPIPLPAPKILVLGPVDLINAGGKVEPSKRSRLLEYAVYLALNPGANHTAIDDAIWPDRKTEDNLNTRNTATSKLRRWLGTDPDGNEYLPKHSGNGYPLHPAVTTDSDDWDQLIAEDPIHASTENLEQALRLVRGIPFEGTHRRRYAWNEQLKQRLISEIVDAAYELGRRHLMSGRWRAAEQALIVGLRVEPAHESLWRLRLLAAHESHNPAAEAETIERLLTITEQLGCDLEPETEELLAALKTPAGLDQLIAVAR